MERPKGLFAILLATDQNAADIYLGPAPVEIGQPWNVPTVHFIITRNYLDSEGKEHVISTLEVDEERWTQWFGDRNPDELFPWARTVWDFVEHCLKGGYWLVCPFWGCDFETHNYDELADHLRSHAARTAKLLNMYLKGK